MNEVLTGTLALSALVLTLTFLVMGAKAFLQPGNPVSIRINESKAVSAVAGQTLFEALGAAGYRLPGSCGGKGTCGLCRVTVPGTGAEVLPSEQARLSRMKSAIMSDWLVRCRCATMWQSNCRPRCSMR